MDIRVEIQGGRELQEKLAGLGSAAGRLLRRAIFAEAEELAATCKERAPVMDGILRGTIQAKLLPSDEVGAEVTAGGPAAPYALAVHENPRSGKTGGVSPSGKPYQKWAKVGEWKYMENPALEKAKTFAADVARRMSIDDVARSA